MNLVVNSIVKSHMRNRRIKLTMVLCLAAQRRNPPNSNPCFNPPAPQLKDGIPGLFTLKNEKFRCPKYQSSIHRVFQSVGLAPIPTPSDPIGIFVTHQGLNLQKNIEKIYSIGKETRIGRRKIVK